MNEWRPERWRNPHQGLPTDEIFEAGADAMLKALKEKGAWMTPEQMKLLAPDRKYPYGYIVFIPEEKQMPVSVKVGGQEGITSNKAIEILTGAIIHHAIKTTLQELPGTIQDWDAAHKLGIEALKAIELYRTTYPLSIPSRLPGEIKE